jgi:hypothetical protein
MNLPASAGLSFSLIAGKWSEKPAKLKQLADSWNQFGGNSVAGGVKSNPKCHSAPVQ